MKRVIGPVKQLRGVLKVPGDESISHRALVLGALATGKHSVEGLSRAESVTCTLNGLRALGCFAEMMPDGRLLILSQGIGDDALLDAGRSDTTAMLMAGLAAGMDVTVTIDGDESLRRRPVARVAESLVTMGAAITLSEGGTLPMTIHGGGLTGIRYELPIPGAHLKSAILIAGLSAAGKTTVIESVPTRDHTESILRVMGVGVETDGRAVTVTGGTRIHGAHIVIPGDCSCASCFAAAAACLPGSELYMPVTGVNPRRTGFLKTLEKMGANVVMDNRHEMSGEPAADLTIRPPDGNLRGVTVDDPVLVATMIDELPLLAVVATQAEGETVVRGFRDMWPERINTITGNLSAMGADIESLDNGFVVRGPTPLKGANVSAQEDSRIATAITVAGLLAGSETILDDDSIVEHSYPGFFNDLRALVR